MHEGVSSDLVGLAACVRKVRWTEAVRERALALADELTASARDPSPAVVCALLAEVDQLARLSDSVRYSFTELKRGAPPAMSLPGGPAVEPDGGPVSGGRELVLFLVALMRKSTDVARG
jgi:hypothetical protein